ncbi:MAG: DUF3472 domain-containing protein [Phycisphaerae bacterium]|nr:DUF3472 domain-containing protein [Phycisphaerae bacterium]
MNHRSIIVAIVVSFTAALVQGAPVGKELSVPAATAYISPNVRGARVGRSGVTHWKDPAMKVLWFGEIKTTGKIKCAVRMRLAAGATSSLQLTLAGQSRKASVTGAGKDNVTADFGTFDIAKAGYQRFTLESLSKAGKPFGDLDALILGGPAIEDAHFNLKPRRNAASVHLAYPVPKGVKVAAMYCEMTGLEEPLWTYYMACGWHRGYFGMQVNSPTERRIIFSVWDSGGEPKDRKKVDDANRVKLVAKGQGVKTNSFGGEGTGGHSHLVYPWKTGEKQLFLVTAKPVGEKHTIFSGWYFHPDKKKWMLISSWNAPKEGRYLRGLYSFSENFGGANGHVLRKALYGNQWIRTSEGKWIEITDAKFSHDATGRGDRLDRFMGVEDGQFFLSHGGFVPGSDKYGKKYRRPALRKAPKIVLPTIKGVPPLKQ